MSKTQATFEETKHYNGAVTVRFYPKAHYYTVTDPDYINPVTGEKQPLKNQRLGGATSLTGVMSKGQGLMLYPMYEMKKWLKQYFRSNSIEDIFSSPLTLEEVLKEATTAHVKKSDRGKSVGTDAHAWVESYLRESLRIQEIQGIAEPFTPTGYSSFNIPEIPAVEDIATILRRSYIEVFKALKPKNVDEYMKIPKLLFADAEIQQAMWTEATMLQKSTTAAKAWFDIHKVFVHGTEDTVYSRQLLICGKYDADISVTCSEACDWCYLNGDEEKKINILNEHGKAYEYTGRYIADFKSTNASRDAPKGVYPEYLAQCGVYDVAKTEEFPDITYDGHLILNGSKNEGVFATHFSFERERNNAWAATLSDIKEFMFEAGKEVKESA